MIPRSQTECECGYLFPTRTRKYTFRIRVNKKQRELLNQYAGARRFVWNWGLATIKAWRELELMCQAEDTRKQYKYSFKKLGDEFVRLRKCRRFPWLSDLNSHVTRSALKDLDQTWRQFVKNKNPEQFGFPKFKSKYGKRGRQIWIPEHAKLLDNKTIKMPGIGIFKLMRKCHTDTIGGSVRLHEQAGRWYVSVSISSRPEPVCPVSPANLVGIDIGIKQYAVLSDGTEFANPRWLKQDERKLAHWQRKISRQSPGSNRREQTRRRIQKIHASIANRRKHYAHLVSKRIADQYDAACIESHSLKSQAKGPLAKFVHDVGHGRWRNNMEYKMADRGKTLCIADAKFASSKTCSACGHKMDKMPLSVRNWVCPACGAVHDRDLNAAKNLQAYGTQQVASNQV